MDLLKFFTAGSVDDGKSTLIGRLLYDSESILADQLEALQQSNRKNDDGTLDLAILTDGLKAEREQGITIDRLIKMILSRPARPREVKLMHQLYGEELVHFQKNTAQANELLTVGEYPVNRQILPAKLAAWTVVVSTIMNMDEMTVKR